MTKQEVSAKMQEFISLMQQEKDIDEKLLKVQMTGLKSMAAVNQRIKEHDGYFEQRDELRKKMLAIYEELAGFVAARQKEMGIS